MKGDQKNTSDGLKVSADPVVLFNGLKEYEEKQAGIFFGRDIEIETLTKLVRTSTLTLLFGKSGTGKTSLLNAGVFPKLRKDYCLPFRIRLEFGETSADIITQIKSVLKSEIDRYGFTVQSYPGDETLWEYFHREPLWKLITPVLVFDQFEELFTLAAKSSRFNKEALNAFVEELSYVIENSIPKKLVDKYVQNNEYVRFLHTSQTAKIIFSFREDFLAEFESFSAKIPSIKNARYRLMPMNGHQAFDVITKTWGNAIHTTEANKVVYFLTEHEQERRKKGNDVMPGFDDLVIEPSLISQVCAFIDREKNKEGLKQVSAGFLRKYPKNKILRSLYDEVLLESESEVLPAKDGQEIKPNQVKEFVEDNLITDEGYRTKYIISKVDKAILPGITMLTRKYYLREDAESIELTHDVIVALVKGDREKRRKALAILEAKRKARRRAWLMALFIILGALSIGIIITHSARKINDGLIADNVILEKKKDDLRKDSARLDSAIHENLKLLGGKGNSNTSGFLDSLRNKNQPTIINGLNIDSIRMVLAGLQDSLATKEKQIRETTIAQQEYKRKILEDLQSNIVERKKLETEINDLKVKFDADRNLLSVNNVKADETAKKLNANLQKTIEKNNELQLKLKKVENDFSSLKIDTDTKIITLQAKIDDLQNDLKRYKSYFDPKRYPKSDKQIFGYGYDYAEDKVKRKKE